ncbi:hypothetical protein Bbelb_276500 [Branchiostoma belcheri]|nr:hypothetical protein Bbelb_276500 [Branchiostoma belcheri]
MADGVYTTKDAVRFAATFGPLDNLLNGYTLRIGPTAGRIARRPQARGRAGTEGDAEYTIPQDTPGFPGIVYSNCSPSLDGNAQMAVTVKVGMNVKAAFKLMETIRAHHSKMPITVFVYGDFAQLFPDLITRWSVRYDIGIRELTFYRRVDRRPLESCKFWLVGYTGREHLPALVAFIAGSSHIHANLS